MSGRGATLVAILGLVLTACSAAAQPSDVTRGIPDPPAGRASLVPVTAPPVAVATATPQPTPEPTPRPTPKTTAKATTAPPPPKPTGVKFVAEDAICLQEVEEDCVRQKYTQTVLWQAPRTKGVEIRVFGVTECLARPEHPKPGANGPCLVKGTNLQSSVRTLLAQAPASAGWVSWSWTAEEEGGCDIAPSSVGTAPDGRGYDAVVVQAFSATDRSSFTIAEPGGWFEPDPESGDQIC